jgi:hypothetical protein
MALIRPRLTDYYSILAPQADLDFAIPFFDEDIPLYVDPFLLWRSPSQQDQALHTGLINAFNNLGQLAATGKENQAIEALIIASECDEVGLGSSATRHGKRIGEDKAREIVSLFKRIPQYSRSGFHHFEEIQFFVDGISKDRIYEEAIGQLLPSLLYPDLDFAQVQARTDSGVSIRDLIFYNTRRVVVDGETSDIPSGPPSKVGRR